MELWKCPRCGNEDIKFIGRKKGIPYCRRCIEFQGEEVSYTFRQKQEVHYELKYPLSPEQIRASNEILEGYLHNENVLVHAVCGAGKTELVYPVISKALSEGKRVGFAIPRKDVVIELYPRLCSSFPHVRIVAVYGGNHQELEGDIVLITTHQLYRYPSYFDLLIVDEIDAFPFQNNEVLHHFFKKSLRNSYIWMSATPSKQLCKYFTRPGHRIVRLMTRFHEHPLPVPKYQIFPFPILLLQSIQKLKEWQKERKPALVFVPTIDLCHSLFQKISPFVKNGEYVHSQREEREKIIERFKKKELDYLVTTSVLERGVTVKNLQVIVFFASHPIYTSYSLVQISGRVGRKIDATDGEVWFYATNKNKEMQQAEDEIIQANQVLQNMLSSRNSR